MIIQDIKVRKSTLSLHRINKAKTVTINYTIDKQKFAIPDIVKDTIFKARR